MPKWTCSCSVENPFAKSKCSACGKLKPKAPTAAATKKAMATASPKSKFVTPPPSQRISAPKPSAKASKNPPSQASSVQSSRTNTPSGTQTRLLSNPSSANLKSAPASQTKTKWNCLACTSENNSTRSKCAVCGADKDGKLAAQVLKQQSKLMAANTARKTDASQTAPNSQNPHIEDAGSKDKGHAKSSSYYAARSDSPPSQVSRETLHSKSDSAKKWKIPKPLASSSEKSNKAPHDTLPDSTTTPQSPHNRKHYSDEDDHDDDKDDDDDDECDLFQNIEGEAASIEVNFGSNSAASDVPNSRGCLPTNDNNEDDDDANHFHEDVHGHERNDVDQPHLTKQHETPNGKRESQSYTACGVSPKTNTSDRTPPRLTAETVCALTIESTTSILVGPSSASTDNLVVEGAPYDQQHEDEKEMCEDKHHRCGDSMDLPLCTLAVNGLGPSLRSDEASSTIGGLGAADQIEEGLGDNTEINDNVKSYDTIHGDDPGEASSDRLVSSIFSTASGKPVTISKLQLREAANKMSVRSADGFGLPDFTNNNASKGEEVDKENSAEGINRARESRGKKFVVPLAKETEILKSASNDKSSHHEPDNVIPKFGSEAETPVASGDKVVSNFFTSASGKPVLISKKGLENALEKIKTDNGDEEVPPSKSPEKQHVSITSSAGLNQSDEDTVVSNLFMSAAGKPVLINKKNLAAAKKKLHDDSSSESPLGSLDTSLSGGPSETGTAGEKIISNIFTSAAGKPVLISKKGIEHAAKKIQELSGVTEQAQHTAAPTSNNERVELSLFSTAGGAKVSVSAASLRKAKDLVLSSEPTLFETGSGKPIKLTPEALQRGEEIMARLSQSDMPNENEKLDSQIKEKRISDKRPRSVSEEVDEETPALHVRRLESNRLEGKTLTAEENADGNDDDTALASYPNKSNVRTLHRVQTSFNAPRSSSAGIGTTASPLNTHRVGGGSATNIASNSSPSSSTRVGIMGNVGAGLRGGRKGFVPPTIKVQSPAISNQSASPPSTVTKKNINYGNTHHHNTDKSSVLVHKKSSSGDVENSHKKIENGGGGEVVVGGREKALRSIAYEFSLTNDTVAQKGHDEKTEVSSSAQTTTYLREGLSFLECDEFEFPSICVRCPVAQRLFFGNVGSSSVDACPQSPLLLSDANDLFVNPACYQRALVCLGADVKGCSLEWVRNAITISHWLALHMPQQHKPPIGPTQMGKADSVEENEETSTATHTNKWRQFSYGPEHVLAFLVGRYNDEYVGGNRPVLKKMCEKDLLTTSRMALWVVHIYGGGAGVNNALRHASLHRSHGTHPTPYRRNTFASPSKQPHSSSPTTLSHGIHTQSHKKDKNSQANTQTAQNSQHPCPEHPVALAAAAAQNYVVPPSLNGGGELNENCSKVLLSDGCYVVTASVDAPTRSLICDGFVIVGSLIEVWGATSQSDNAGTPLELGLNVTVLGLNYNGLKIHDPFVALSSPSRNLSGSHESPQDGEKEEKRLMSVGLLNISPEDFPTVSVRKIHPLGGAVPSIVGVVTRVLPPHFQEREVHNSDAGTSNGGYGGGRRSGRFSENNGLRAPRIVRNKIAEEKRNDSVLRTMQQETERMFERRGGGSSEDGGLSFSERDEIIQTIRDKYARDVNIVCTIVIEEDSGNVAVVQQWMEGTSSTYASMESNVPKEGTKIRMFNLHPSRSGRPMAPFHGKLLFSRPTFNFLVVNDKPQNESSNMRDNDNVREAEDTSATQQFAFERRTFNNFDTFEGSITNTMVDICCFVIDVVKTVPLAAPKRTTVEDSVSSVFEATSQLVHMHNSTIPFGAEITTIVFCTTTSNTYGSLEIVSTPHLEINLACPQPGSVAVFQNIIYKTFDTTSGENNVVRFSANEYTAIIQNSSQPQVAQLIREMETVSRQLPSVKSTLENGRNLLARAANTDIGEVSGHACLSFLVRPPPHSQHNQSVSDQQGGSGYSDTGLGGISVGRLGNNSSCSPRASAPSGPLLPTDPLDYAVCIGSSLQQGGHRVTASTLNTSTASSHTRDRPQSSVNPCGASMKRATINMTSALLGGPSIDLLENNSNSNSGPSAPIATPTRGLFSPISVTGSSAVESDLSAPPTDDADTSLRSTLSPGAIHEHTAQAANGARGSGSHSQVNFNSPTAGAGSNFSAQPPPPKRTVLFPKSSVSPKANADGPLSESAPKSLEDDWEEIKNSEKSPQNIPTRPCVFNPPPPLRDEKESPWALSKSKSPTNSPTKSQLKREAIAMGKLSAAVAMAFPFLDEDDDDNAAAEKKHHQESPTTAVEESTRSLARKSSSFGVPAPPPIDHTQAGNDDNPGTNNSDDQARQNNVSSSRSSVCADPSPEGFRAFFPSNPEQQKHHFGNLMPSSFVLRVTCGTIATINHPLTDYMSSSFKARFRVPQISVPGDAVGDDEASALVPFFTLDRHSVMSFGLDVSLIADFTNGFALVPTVIHGIDAISSLLAEMVGPASKLSSTAAVTEEWYQLSISRSAILQRLDTEEERWRALLLQSAVVTSDDLGLCVKDEEVHSYINSHSMHATGAGDEGNSNHFSAGADGLPTTVTVIDFPALGTLKRWNQSAFTAGELNNDILWWHEDEWIRVKQAIFASFHDRLVKVTVSEPTTNQTEINSCSSSVNSSTVFTNAVYPLTACYPIKDACNISTLI